MSSHTVTVTSENFEAEVLKASHDTLVLIDFWAPWCAPCRALKPILERLAEEYAGRFILAKLDTDELPELAQRFGIRGIPNVKAVINGEVTAEFTGAIPEPKVREFLDKLLPGEGEKLRRVAATAVREGDFETAEIALRDAVGKEPALTVARLDLAELLIPRQAFTEAELVLEPIPEQERDDNDRIQKLIGQIEVWKAGQSLPPTTELLDDIQQSPDDLQLRLKLAERYMADSQFEAALEALIWVVEHDRNDLREVARRTMVQVFGFASDQPDVVGRYRRQLAAVLN